MLAARDVSKSFGAEVVLVRVSLVVPPGTRIGVVGPNGAGKSTLLRLLAGLEDPDAGAVERSPGSLSRGYLPQEPDLRPQETLLAYLARRTGVAAAQAELDALAARLTAQPGLVAAHDDTLERFLALGGADFEARARAVCAELGLDSRRSSFSGGESARARLAVVVLARFEVLLLDEPTNDLDFAGLDLLERFVASTPAAVVLVSHDRVFLDRTVTRIAELDPWTNGLREWSGGWSGYEAARELARSRQYEAFERARGRRVELEALLRERRGQARGGAGLGKRTGRADRRATRALSTKVRQAERALERVERVEKPYEPWELRLSLAARQRPADRVLSLEGAVAGRGSFRLGPVDLALAPAERLAVTGANGSGKSTLLAMVLGELRLAGGRRLVGPRTVIGSLDQARLGYGGEERLLAAFVERTGVAPVAARTLLAKFELGAAHVDRRCSTLSPGERTRAHLAELMARGANLLVLDEPTNHLDLPAIEQLETALAAYDGALVVVSHDRRFLERLAPTRSMALS